MLLATEGKITMEPSNPRILDLNAAMTKIRDRADAINNWLKSIDSECKEEQKQADEGTPEREYWHYGYRSACLDILQLLEDSSEAIN